MQSATRRERCYAARDAYFQCARQHGRESTECSKELLAAYETECPGSWRSYFQQAEERQTVLEMQAEISRQKSGRANA